MTLTSPHCPVAEILPNQVKRAVEEIKELPKQEIINAPVIPKEKEVSARGKVLCFERAKQEKNEFLSKKKKIHHPSSF